MTPWLIDPDLCLFHGDCLEVMRDGLDYDAIVTSPPYLDARPEYGHPDAQWWDQFFSAAHGPALINVGRLWRDGCESDWWIRLLGYAKANGWKHRDTLVWVKPNANPIQGRVLADSHEYVLLLNNTETEFDPDAIRTRYAPESFARAQRRFVNGRGVKGEGGGNERREMNELGARPRSYVEVYTGREKGNPHPAPMALDLALHLVKLSGGHTVLDPFAGSGTTAVAARKLGRRAVLVELNESYLEIAAKRLQQLSLLTEGAQQ